MNIAIDAFPLTEKAPSGIPIYVRNILLHLLNIDKENKYFLYSRKKCDFPNSLNLEIRYCAIGGDADKSYKNTLWLFTKGIRLMKKDMINLFWGTRQMLPPNLPDVKRLLIAYDLVWHYFPETMGRYNLSVARTIIKKSIKSAGHIITISEAAASALGEVLGIHRERISVIYPAADKYIPLDKDDSAEYISEKYKANKGYILTVGTVEPRKNLITLLRAFSKFRSEGYQLIIAGASGWKTSNIYKEYQSLGFSEKEVKFLGYVPDEDMNSLYSGAQLFLFPSVYEGFGVPALEAMASGTPVIASDSSALPEVVGDAGMLIDSRDVKGWEDAILKIMTDKSCRNVLRVKGIERSKKFSWDASARQAMEVLERFA